MSSYGWALQRENHLMESGFPKKPNTWKTKEDAERFNKHPCLPECAYRDWIAVPLPIYWRVG